MTPTLLVALGAALVLMLLLALRAATSRLPTTFEARASHPTEHAAPVLPLSLSGKPPEGDVTRWSEDLGASRLDVTVEEVGDDHAVLLATDAVVAMLARTRLTWREGRVDVLHVMHITAAGPREAVFRWVLHLGGADRAARDIAARAGGVR